MSTKPLATLSLLRQAQMPNCPSTFRHQLWTNGPGEQSGLRVYTCTTMLSAMWFMAGTKLHYKGTSSSYMHSSHVSTDTHGTAEKSPTESLIAHASAWAWQFFVYAKHTATTRPNSAKSDKK